HARHDGAVAVAALLAFLARQHLASLSGARGTRATGDRLLGLRSRIQSLTRCRSLPRLRRLPILPVAAGDRLLVAALLALIVVVEERALGADDFHASIAVHLEAVLADQRADPRGPGLDRIERVGRGKLGVEFGL